MDIEALARRYPASTIVLAGVLLLAVSLPLWWFKVYLSPQRAFSDMLKQNFTTTGVTKTINLSSKQQSVRQTVRLNFGATNAARGLVTARQSGESVTTESIGTPTADYVRYTDISAKAAKTKQAFAPLLNVWGKDSSGGKLFTEAVLDVNNAPTLPIGRVTPTERQSMLDFINQQKVFTPDYAGVKTVRVNGRSAYQYRVAIAQEPYVRLMQAFETDLGLTALQDVSASQYQNQPPATITVTVDKVAHNLLKLSYPTHRYTVRYQAWGQLTPIKPPQHTIPLDQLKQRLSKVSQ